MKLANGATQAFLAGKHKIQCTGMCLLEQAQECVDVKCREDTQKADDLDKAPGHVLIHSTPTCSSCPLGFVNVDWQPVQDPANCVFKVPDVALRENIAFHHVIGDLELLNRPVLSRVVHTCSSSLRKTGSGQACGVFIV